MDFLGLCRFTEYLIAQRQFTSSFGEQVKNGQVHSRGHFCPLDPDPISSDANFEEGLNIAKATGANEVWSGRGNMPTIHLMGGTIMGTEARNSLTLTRTDNLLRSPGCAVRDTS